MTIENSTAVVDKHLLSTGNMHTIVTEKRRLNATAWANRLKQALNKLLPLLKSIWLRMVKCVNNSLRFKPHFTQLSIVGKIEIAC